MMVVLASIALAATVNISVDSTMAPIKDLRTLKAGAGFGFNGYLGEGVHANADWFYNVDQANTAKAFAESGTRIVRMQNATVRFQSERAERVSFYTTYKQFDWGRSALDMKRWRSWTPHENFFKFFMKHGMKVVICLDGSVYDPAADRMTNDVAQVEKVTLEYLRWIRDNGFADCVIGVELENEPYFGKSPSDYAARWSRIVPKMRQVWPGLQVGMPIAIYDRNDPDLDAVRRRGQLVDALDGPAHTADHVNQWTGNAITAMTQEALTNITHVQIHTYGANGSYTANFGGIEKARRMKRIYPELDGKPFWITEWRDRSDEDWDCHRRFITTLWKAQYLQMVVCQGDVDATFLHANGTCAGNLYESNGKKWLFQRDENKTFGIPDITGNGDWRLDVGTAGPLFRIFLHAFDRHPLVLAHGDEKGFGFNANTRMYDADVARMFARRDGKAEPPRVTDLTWVIATDVKRRTYAFLLVNTHEEPRHVDLSVSGCTFGDGVVRAITCASGLERAMEIPSEPKPWRVNAYQKAFKGGLTVPAQSIVVVEVAVHPSAKAAEKKNPDLPD